MLENNKCTLVYGTSIEEIDGLKKQGLKVLKVTNEMTDMKVEDIVNGLRILKYNSTTPKEKIIVFNNYSDEEVKENVNTVRKVVKGGILAAVTPVSSEWTFGELISHLVHEREWFNSRQKGR